MMIMMLTTMIIIAFQYFIPQGKINDDDDDDDDDDDNEDYNISNKFNYCCYNYDSKAQYAKSRGQRSASPHRN